MAKAVRDLMSGDMKMSVQLLTRTLTVLHATGNIRLLAVTSTMGLNIAPEIPTSIVAGLKNMSEAEYFYLFAPAGTPVPILQRLNDTSRAALTDAEFKKKLEGAGFDPIFAGGLDETRKLFESERARWLPIAEAAGTKIN
jgi:tripartite-type tricarboxylate transporter receptor subunit TctC